ncbi:hypothetical protein H6503_06970 [Candidatus Woesearchaeota archaeon]|nr:hypothetical protein [Candidatus Woesearchaeota archaeon]
MLDQKYSWLSPTVIERFKIGPFYENTHNSDEMAQIVTASSEGIMQASIEQVFSKGSTVKGSAIARAFGLGTEFQRYEKARLKTIMLVPFKIKQSYEKLPGNPDIIYSITETGDICE